MPKRKPLAAAFKRTSTAQDEDKPQEARSALLRSGKPLEAAEHTGVEPEQEGLPYITLQAGSPAHDAVGTVQEEQKGSIGVAQPLIGRGEVEVVPGPKGVMIPADKPVNMTFTVTAKERYLWNLELSRRGLTGVSVLRDAMSRLLNRR